LTHVINAAKEGKERDDDERYQRHGLKAPVLWQAKAPRDLASGERGAGGFLSAPNTYTSKFARHYRGRSAINHSCNDHFMGISTGVVLKISDSDRITQIRANLARRYGDRAIDRNKEPQHGPVIETSAVGPESAYISHFNAMFPELEGKLIVHRSLNPWTPFHQGTIEFDIRGGVDNRMFEAVKDSFREYPRCIFLGELGKEIGKSYSADNIVDACEYYDIPHEGDCLLPVITVERPVSDMLVVKGLNPQRSVVVPGAMDWVQIVDGADWETAFNNTNERLRWHGYSVLELKENMERYLKRELRR